MKNLSLIVVVVAAAAAVAGAAPLGTALDASFVCASPADWDVARRPDGAVFSGPRDENGVAAVITIRYVSPDNKLYSSPEDYVRRLTAKPDVAISGWSVGPVTTAVVAGRASKRVISDVSDFVPPHSLNTKEVPVREEQLAVPASRGFYVLIFRAPRAQFALRRAVFARVMASFKPKL